MTSRAKKSKNTVFLDPADDKALDEIERKTALERGPVSRAAIHAVAEYWRRYGSLTLPLVAIPEKEFLELISKRKNKADRAILSDAIESRHSSGQ